MDDHRVPQPGCHEGVGNAALYHEGPAEVERGASPGRLRDVVLDVDAEPAGDQNEPRERHAMPVASLDPAE